MKFKNNHIARATEVIFKVMTLPLNIINFFQRYVGNFLGFFFGFIINCVLLWNNFMPFSNYTFNRVFYVWLAACTFLSLIPRYSYQGKLNRRRKNK